MQHSFTSVKRKKRSKSSLFRIGFYWFYGLKLQQSKQPILIRSRAVQSCVLYTASTVRDGEGTGSKQMEAEAQQKERIHLFESNVRCTPLLY
jgi:hypothetical protein